MIDPELPADPTDVDDPRIDLPQLLRLSAMMQSLLVEARDVDLADDAPARRRLAEVQRRAVDAITSVVPARMADELRTLSPIAAADDRDPSEGELRLTQSQVTGWLTGLFQAFQVVALEQQLRGPTAPPQLTAPEPGGSGPYL